MIDRFQTAPVPRIHFGSGVLDQLLPEVTEFGGRILLVMGRGSFRATTHYHQLIGQFRLHDIEVVEQTISTEPSPELVDSIVSEVRGGYGDITCVVAIGGGSVLDAAKAISGLLLPGNSVMDHLEGVGPELPYRGPATPYIAVPRLVPVVK